MYQNLGDGTKYQQEKFNHNYLCQKKQKTENQYKYSFQEIKKQENQKFKRLVKMVVEINEIEN